jgi:hypothetical protein
MLSCHPTKLKNPCPVSVWGFFIISITDYSITDYLPGLRSVTLQASELHLVLNAVIVRSIAKAGWTVTGSDHEKVLIHNACNRTLATLLVEMQDPAFPVAMDVIYDNPAVTADGETLYNRQQPQSMLDEPSLVQLITGKASWMVE